jgi:hypothetical protein
MTAFTYLNFMGGPLAMILGFFVRLSRFFSLLVVAQNVLLQRSRR